MKTTVRRPRARLARRAAAIAAVGCSVVALGHLPLTSAAFTAQTANGGSTFASAANFCTPGSATLAVTADAMVRQSNPNSNYGNDNGIEVRSHLNDNRRIYLLPDLPPINSRCTILSATLTLRERTYEPSRTNLAYRAAGAWNEGTLTWNNQPGVVGFPTAAVTTQNSWSIDVTGPVRGLYLNGNTGLVIRDWVEDSGPIRHQRYDSLDSKGTDPVIAYTWG